jgi:hypothetical protein
VESNVHRQPSRIAAARARAATVKQALLTSALALFFAVMLLARATHPAQSAQLTSVSNAASNTGDSFGNSSDDFEAGSIAPAQSAPQVATGGS